MSKILKEDFDKRWGKKSDQMYNPRVQRGLYNRQVLIHHVFYICTFLDPRWRLFLGLDMDGLSKQLIHQKVIKLMIEVQNLKEAASAEEETGVDPATQDLNRAVGTVGGNNGSNPVHAFALLNQEHNQRRATDLTGNDCSIKKTCEDEFEKYLTCLTPEYEENPLIWWKSNQMLYPTLAVLARKYLAVQATSAPLEIIFRVEPIFYVSENIGWYDTFNDE